MTTRQLPGFSILLTQYTLCKFILISTKLLTLLSPFSSSASGLLLHNRASDFGEEVGIFSSIHHSTPHTLSIPFFSCLFLSQFSFCGEKSNLLLVSGKNYPNVSACKQNYTFNLWVPLARDEYPLLFSPFPFPLDAGSFPTA